MQQERIHQKPLEACKVQRRVNIDTNEMLQEHSTEKISSLHSRLKQEAEKIRKWKIQTELDLKQKEKKIQEASLTIDSLRKGILDLQIQNEKLSAKFQEELQNQNEIVERHAATREMCNILKDYASKVEDRLQKCEAEKTEMKYFEKNSLEQFENLSEKFKNLEITTTEMLNNLKDEIESEKQEKLETENTYKVTLQNTESELQEMVKTCGSQTHQITALNEELEESKAKLEQIQKEHTDIQSKLATVENAYMKIEAELKGKCNEIDTLRLEVDQLNIDKQNLQTALDVQREETDNLSQELKRFQNQLCQSEKELLCKTKLVDNLTEQMQILTSQIQENEQELKEVKDSLEAMIDRDKVNCDHIESLKAELLNERKRTRDEELKLFEVINEKTNLQTKFNKLKQESNVLKNELENSRQVESALLQQTSEMTSQISCLRKQISEMEMKIKQQEKEANKLKTEISDIANLKAECAEKEELLLELRKQCTDKEKELSSRSNTISDLENRLEKTEMELTQIKAEKIKTEKGHESHVNELVAVFDKYKKMGDELALEQQKEIERLTNQLKELEQKGSEFTKLQKMYKKTKLQLSEMEENKAATILQLEQQLSNLSAELDVKQNSLAEKEQLLQTFVAKEADWREQEAKQKVLHEKKLDDLLKSHTKLQDELDQLNEELKALKAKERENIMKIDQLEKDRLQLLKLKKKSDVKCVSLESENKELQKNKREINEKLETSAKYKDTEERELQKFRIHSNKNQYKKEGKATTKSFHSHPDKTENIPVCSPVKAKSASDVLNGNSSPSRNAVKEVQNSPAKKRRIVFNSNEEACHSDSSFDLMELEMDDVGIHIRNQTAKPGSTPVKLTSSTINEQTPSKPVPRGPPSSVKGATEKKHQETSKTNIRKTPNKPQAKFFKSPPSIRKKTKSKEDITWFDSDVVFGFHVED